MGLAIPLSQFSFAIASDISIAFDAKLDDDPDRWQFTAMSFGPVTRSRRAYEAAPQTMCGWYCTKQYP